MEEVLNRLESWMAKIEAENCEGCPALQWVNHRDGQHSCRLSFESIESGNHAASVSPCIRPKAVGAGYVIARELGNPKPMVGKLHKWQYDRYEAEMRAFEASHADS